MLRLAGGVVVGYLAMALVVFGTFSLAFQLMGAEDAFRPGSYEVSIAWAVTSLLLGFIAALGGGWISITFARSRIAPRVLAGIVVILGMAAAMPALTRGEEEPPPREETVDATEAMANARQPVWLALLNPLVGVTGVLLGARLRRRALPLRDLDQLVR